MQHVNLSQWIKFVNSILEHKYNKPLERGKRQQKQNAYQLNNNRRMNTLNRLLKWYRKSGLELEEIKEKITITKIAMGIRLHPNTIRGVLLEYNDRYKLGYRPNIAKNVMYILEKIAEIESICED
jgi:hypothetical protein